MAPILTMRLAQVLSGLGRVEEAQAILLKGIERNPQFPHNYRHLAAQLLALGRVGEALRWYRAGMRLAPSLIRSRIYECSFWLQLGDDRSAEHCFDSVEETFSQRAFGSRVDLHLFRAEFQEAVELGEQLAQRELDPYARSILAWLYVINGEADKAMSIWQDMEAELFGDEDVIIEPNELWKTALVAQTLYVDGQLDRANYLFDQALATMRSMHRIRGPGYGTWDVFIHAARGEKQEAISALREAVDMGWREDWWRLRFPYFDSMREEPEWIGLLAELEADPQRVQLHMTQMEQTIQSCVDRIDELVKVGEIVKTIQLVAIEHRNRARMVVNQDHCGGGLPDGRPEDLSRMDDRAG